MNPGVAVNVRRAGLEDGPVRDLLILALAGLALFVWRLGSHDLWPPDEPRFALVAREMWQRADYAVLSLDDRLYTDKPPLFFWAVNGFGRLLGGIDERAARLPSAVAGLLALLLTYRLGTSLYERRTGLYAALVFATSVQIVERARWASIDMTLNLFILSAVVLLWRSWTAPERAPWVVRGAWILMGLATLAKGPVGLLLPLLAVLPAMLLERDLRAVGRVVVPSGIALYLAVTLSWFGVFAHRLGLGFALKVLVHQNVERYVDAWNSRHPAWYYLWRFPAGFFPWSLVFPWGIAQGCAPEEARHRRSVVFLVTWIVAIFVFFSFSTGKRGVYIIPLYPAASILVGRLLAQAGAPETCGGREARRRLLPPLALWIAFGALLAFGLPLLARVRFPSLAPVAGIMGLALLAGGSASCALVRRRGGAGAPACLAASAGIALLVVVGAAVPRVNAYQNIKGFAAQVKARLEPGARFATTEQKRDAWVFYTGRFAEPLDTPESVLAYLALQGPCDLLIEEDKLREVRAVLPAGVVEILRGRVGSQEYHLLHRASRP